MKLAILLFPIVMYGQMPPSVTGALVGGGGGGIAYVNSVCGPAFPGSGGGAANAFSTVGANFIVGVVAANSAASVTITDVTFGNTITTQTWVPSSGTPAVVIFYEQNPTVGASHVFSVTGITQYPGFCVAAFSGLVTSGVYVTGSAPAGNTALGTTVQPGTITPGSGNQLLITGMGDSASGSITIDSGFTAITQGYIGGQAYGVGLGYLIQSGSATANPTWTYPSGPSAAVGAAFQGR